MATVKNSNAEMVSVYVPKISGEDPTLFVGLNGKSWSIPRGKRVEVPIDVARIVEESEKNAQIADEFSDEKRKDMDVIHGAP